MMWVAAAEEGGFNPLKPEFGLAFWVTIAFLVVLYFLAKKVFPKLEETLADRERRIKENLEEAERTKAEAERMLEDYRRRVAEVREEANRIVDEARQTAESARKDLLAKAEAEAREVVRKAQEQLTGERDRAVSQLQGHLAAWSTQIAARIVEKELDEGAHRALVDGFIRELQQESQAR